MILKITGDWQKFKGLPGAEGTLRAQGRTKVDPRRRQVEARSPRAGREAPRPTRAAQEGRPPAEAADAAEAPSEAEAERGRELMLVDALEHLVRGIVDHPDDVRVRASRCVAASCSRSGCTPRTSVG